jgi:acetyltransferase-like isoleucine patch superfamily enzyme
MAGYVSPRARVSRQAIIARSAVVLGPTIISSEVLVDDSVVIGYPSRSKLLRLVKVDTGVDLVELMDRASDGAKIGARVILRSGTIVYENVVLEDDVETGHRVLVREGSTIGRGSRIGTNTVIDGESKIGRNVVIQTGVYIPRRTIIEDGVFIGPYAVLTNDRYPPSSRLEGPVIRRGAVIGAGAVILSPVEVGEEAVVAAGAVVTKDVPPRTVVAGVPAKPIGTLDDYIAKRRLWEQAKS